MITVGIKWLLLLAVSEILSYNSSSLKDESVWSVTLGDDNENITGGGTGTVFRIYEGTYTC